MKIIKKIKTIFFLIILVGVVGCAANQNKTNLSKVYLCRSCKSTSEREITALFDRWNQSLKTGDPKKVVANYAEKAILLPTVSNKPRITTQEKEEYFHHFLEKAPSGEIDFRQIEIGCNMAVDSGLYTFTFAKTQETIKARYSFVYRWDGAEWLIVSHHSSMMPEKDKPSIE